jgi:hypothetical protein
LIIHLMKGRALNVTKKRDQERGRPVGTEGLCSKEDCLMNIIESKGFVGALVLASLGLTYFSL